MGGGEQAQAVIAIAAGLRPTVGLNRPGQTSAQADARRHPVVRHATPCMVTRLNFIRDESQCHKLQTLPTA